MFIDEMVCRYNRFAGNLEENYSPENCSDLIFLRVLLCTEWVCVIISLVICLTSSYLVHPHRGWISGTLPWLYAVSLGKASTVDKQERWVENSLLKFICYLRDFRLASYARMIDIGAIESRSFNTFASFTHRLLWIKIFFKRKVSTIRASQVYSLNRVFFHELHICHVV